MNCTYNENLYEHSFRTIDSHTMGEATRNIYDGFPELPGQTMMEKKEYLISHYAHYRKALMLEPRGHRDMFGALLTPPVHEEADYGVIFMDSGGCLNMCGHGSIGTASMLVETGMVDVSEPYTDVVLDAPSGLIRTRVKVQNGKAEQVSILNVPAFLYKENQSIDIQGYGTITVELDGAAAPMTVQNFMDLANDGLYEGLTFHRIIAGFMMQGGDPNGNGTGGSENTIKGEFSSNGVENSLSHTRGAISMARSQNPDSASSQFFICHEDSTFLDGQYACFGYVTDGMDVVDAVCEAAQPTDGNGTIPADQQPVITAIRVID